jgi:hypothetical protein
MEAVAPGIHVELLLEFLALVSHVHAADLGLDDSELGLLEHRGSHPLSPFRAPSGPSDASGAELKAEELIIHEELDEEENTLPDLYRRRLSSKLAKLAKQCRMESRSPRSS